MSKEMIRVLLINVGLLLVLPFLFGGVTSFKDFLSATALTSLGIAIVELLLGVILTVAGRSGTPLKKYGMGALLAGALLLLMSFTLCSTGAFRLDLK